MKSQKFMPCIFIVVVDRGSINDTVKEREKEKSVDYNIWNESQMK
jgi:hypothetical protein